MTDASTVTWTETDVHLSQSTTDTGIELPEKGAEMAIVGKVVSKRLRLNDKTPEAPGGIRV